MKDPVSAGDKELLPEEGIICPSMKIGSFHYSTKHDKVVFCAMEMTANNVCACTYSEWKAMQSGGDINKKAVQFENKSFESDLSGKLPAVDGPAGVEAVGITQMAYDDVNECVYFAYRNSTNVASLPTSGIYCYSFATGEITCLIKGVAAYGVAVNNTPSKLF